MLLSIRLFSTVARKDRSSILISGGSAFDKLLGQGGDDYIYADATTSLIGSLTANETAINERLNELFLGLDNNDLSDLNEMLIDDSLNNNIERADIFGSTQNDLLMMEVSLLVGGEGNDHLYGQSGNDVFVGVQEMITLIAMRV